MHLIRSITNNRLPEYIELTENLSESSICASYWATKVSGYQSIQATRVSELPEFQDYQSIWATRVFRLPKYQDYQSIRAIIVTALPEYLRYQIICVTRLSWLPEYLGLLEYLSYQSILATRVSGLPVYLDYHNIWATRLSELPKYQVPFVVINRINTRKKCRSSRVSHVTDLSTLGNVIYPVILHIYIAITLYVVT